MRLVSFSFFNQAASIENGFFRFQPVFFSYKDYLYVNSFSIFAEILIQVEGLFLSGDSEKSF